MITLSGKQYQHLHQSKPGTATHTETMVTPPTLLVRPRARKFEDLAMEEMRKQQLLSKSKRNQIAPTAGAVENETIEDQILNEKVARTFLEAQQQRLRESLIQSSYVQPEKHAEVDVPSTTSTISSTVTSEENIQKTVETMQSFPVQSSTVLDGSDFVSAGERRGSSDESRGITTVVNPRVEASPKKSVRKVDHKLVPSAKLYRQPLVLEDYHRIAQMEDDDKPASEESSSDSGSYFQSNLPEAAKPVLRNIGVMVPMHQSYASLSFSDDEEQLHVRPHPMYRSTSESGMARMLQHAKFHIKVNNVPNKNFVKRDEGATGSMSAAPSPQLKNSVLPHLDHDLGCDSSEKYVSSDGDNDDASTITRSSGGSNEEAADDEAEDDDGDDDHDDEEDDDEEDRSGESPHFPRHSAKDRQGLNNVKNAQGRNHLQHALERLASLSRSAQNSLTNSISRTWFSENCNSNVTPSSSVGASHFPQSLAQSNFGSFAGDTDSLKYSSMDSGASRYSTSSHTGVGPPVVNYMTSYGNGAAGNNSSAVVVAVGSGGTCNTSIATNASSAGSSNVIPPRHVHVPVLGYYALSGPSSNVAHEGQLMPREGEKHSISSLVPPNLPRSNRSSYHGEGESTQPKHSQSSGRKGRYGSLDNVTYRRRDDDDDDHQEEADETSRLLHMERGVTRRNDSRHKRGASTSSNDAFTLPVDNRTRMDEEMANADAEATSEVHGLDTFHIYLWRGVIAMAVTCLIVFLLLVLLDDLGLVNATLI